MAKNWCSAIISGAIALVSPAAIAAICESLGSVEIPYATGNTSFSSIVPTCRASTAGTRTI